MKESNQSIIKIAVIRIAISFLLIIVNHTLAHCQKIEEQKAGDLSLNHCPDLPLSGWKHNTTSVLDGFMHAYQPCTVETDDAEYPYRMWFFGWISELCNPEYPGCDAIYHARSKDLDKWEVYCKDGSWDSDKKNKKWAAVIYSSVNEATDFYDTWHSGDPSVVLKDGVYYMAYSATSKAITSPVTGYPSGMMLCVMGATSTDGIHWKKTEKPLLKAETDTEFPPKPNPERIGDFHRPTLLWDGKENKWKLYFDFYNSGLQGNFHMGLAENKKDFETGTFDFIHSLNKPLLLNWPNPEVVKIGTCYFSFSDAPGYTGAVVPQGKERSGWMGRQLQMAQSADGISWEKKYFIPSDPGIDASHVPQTLVCKREGKWWLYLFYSTQIGWRRTVMTDSIFAKDSYNWFYDQIRYMKQEIK